MTVELCKNIISLPRIMYQHYSMIDVSVTIKKNILTFSYKMNQA